MVHKSEGVIGDEDEMDAKTSGQEVGAQVMLSPYTRPQWGTPARTGPRKPARTDGHNIACHRRFTFRLSSVWFRRSSLCNLLASSTSGMLGIGAVNTLTQVVLFWSHSWPALRVGLRHGDVSCLHLALREVDRLRRRPLGRHGRPRDEARRPDDRPHRHSEEQRQRVEDVKVNLGRAERAVVSLCVLDDSVDGPDLPGVSATPQYCDHSP